MDLRKILIFCLLLGLWGCQTPIAGVPDPEVPLPSFAESRDDLLLRLVPQEWPQQLPDMLRQSDLPGLVTALVLDSPQSIRTLTTKDAKEWSKSPQTLFDIGLENLRKKSLPESENLEIGDGINVLALADDSYFLAAQTLLMKEHPQWQGLHGCLVAIPRRDTLLLYPVQDSQVVTVLNLLPTICRHLHDEGPGSVSPDIFYYDGNSFEIVAIEEKEGVLTIDPPANLVRALVEISQSKSHLENRSSRKP